MALSVEELGDLDRPACTGLRPLTRPPLPRCAGRCEAADRRPLVTLVPGDLTSLKVVNDTRHPVNHDRWAVPPIDRRRWSFLEA